MPARIGEAGNTTFGISLGLLAHRGFTVVLPDSDSDYWAIRADGTSLIGSTPLVLVGLMAILDHLGDDWYRAPRIDLPKGDVIDLSPDSLARMPEAQLARAREAQVLLESIRGRVSKDEA